MQHQKMIDRPINMSSLYEWTKWSEWNETGNGNVLTTFWTIPISNFVLRPFRIVRIRSNEWKLINGCCSATGVLLLIRFASSPFNSSTLMLILPSSILSSSIYNCTRTKCAHLMRYIIINTHTYKHTHIWNGHYMSIGPGTWLKLICVANQWSAILHFSLTNIEIHFLTQLYR